MAVCAVAACASGCNKDIMMGSFFNGLLNPSELGSYGLLGKEGTLDIRSSLTLQDAPTDVMGVSDPLPEDLVPVVREYEYRVGDMVAVRIFELLQQGTETMVAGLIDETGCITLPVIGRIEIVGLTLPEIEAEIIDQVIRHGILVEPEVVVEPGVRRKLSYTIYGAISQPNLYPLSQYDLRLLDAINVAGGLVDSVSSIYVVRDEELPEPILVSRLPIRRRSEAPHAGAPLNLSNVDTAEAGTGLARSSAQPRSEASKPPGPTTNTASRQTSNPVADEPPATRSTSTSTAPIPSTPSIPQWAYKNGEWVEVAADRPSPEPSSAPLVAPAAGKGARKELIEAMIGEPATSSPTVAEPVELVPATPSQPRWIYYNGKWIETEAPTSTPAEITSSRQIEAPQRATQPSIDWSEVAGLNEHRVIRISADALREGDPRHNIIVRPGDAIRLVSGQYGEYYVMGHIGRPGAYSLTGRQITLKTAVAAAGNLSPLAWPAHCTIYRRLGDREQMIQLNLDAIFAGREQDFFLKRDDLILVGTHPVATFLAVLRNAFRMSYGFGFVYDRNFADIDSFGAQPNPVYQQERFPNLFQ